MIYFTFKNIAPAAVGRMDLAEWDLRFHKQKEYSGSGAVR